MNQIHSVQSVLVRFMFACLIDVFMSKVHVYCTELSVCLHFQFMMTFGFDVALFMSMKLLILMNCFRVVKLKTLFYLNKCM